MFVSKLLMADIVTLPKNQLRLFYSIISSSNPHTNVGYVSFEMTTASQVQRNTADLRALVKLGYIKKYPMIRASEDMRKLYIRKNRRISYYMANPIHQHSFTADKQGLQNIWPLLK